MASKGSPVPDLSNATEAVDEFLRYCVGENTRAPVWLAWRKIKQTLSVLECE